VSEKKKAFVYSSHAVATRRSLHACLFCDSYHFTYSIGS
jgi:hypothetical protein